MAASKKPTIRRLPVYALAVGVILLASPHPVLLALGAGLATLGEALRLWACGHLRKNQAVIQSGPYAHVKNPLYLGTFLILLGAILAASNPATSSRYLVILVLPFCLGVFFVYYLPYKFAVEGDRLRRRFGEVWETYDRQVPDFIPRLTPFRHSDVRWDPRLVAENSEVSAAIWVGLLFALLTARAFLDVPGIG
jgi:protein-S-isoprenylcysteine O-methyltransferase Ste14